jgi:class 3 adenylate cyclase
VEFSKHTAVDLPVRLVQFAIGILLIAAGLGFVILFGLQFSHSSRIDGTWIIGQIHLYQDPMVSEVASWFDTRWPSSSLSFVPLGVALASWGCKILLDMAFLRVRRVLRRLVPPPRPAVALDAATMGLFAGDSTISADSEHAREELLKRYREIESALKSAKRKRCAFLSVDIVGSTQMKIGERDADIGATFQAYEEMLKKIFEQYGAWKQAWTPDGVMICFLQLDLAVGAAQRILQGLKKFNEHDNRLRTPIRVRCGLNVGEVPIYEDSKLEKVADHSIDVAGHMQKQGNVDALWVGHNVLEKISDQSAFHPTGQTVDGFQVFEWTPESAVASKEAQAATTPRETT